MGLLTNSSCIVLGLRFTMMTDLRKKHSPNDCIWNESIVW